MGKIFKRTDAGHLLKKNCTLATGLEKQDKSNDINMRTCPHCHEKKHKFSLNRHIKSVHKKTDLSDEEPKPKWSMNGKLGSKPTTGKIIQPVEQLETVPEKMGAAEKSDFDLFERDYKLKR